MRQKLAFFLLSFFTFSAVAAQKPKLIVAIAVDQFRYDYLLRFRSEYKQGLDRLLTRGAVFSNAYYDHFPTVTAIGHSTFLTGATPALSGIVANDWFDRETGKTVTSVSDDSVKMLGGNGDGGASPHRLLVSTVGDELKMSNGGRRAWSECRLKIAARFSLQATWRTALSGSMRRAVLSSAALTTFRRCRRG